MMKIGQLAEQSGVPASTIRYYEKQGLMPATKRGANGYRSYDQSALDRLQLIRFSQNLGFSLHEMPRLMDTGDGVDHERVMARLEEKQQELATLISQLQHKHHHMQALIQQLKDVWQQGQCMQPEQVGELLQKMQSQ
ncbi:MerR family transcriptional regulator [Aestuariibacter halophilus]|uniref:MerR family transcriptional regulator n=1 Tax=Fluctibacter halophilus TaxID=226011 RepID=A0ABS8G7H8_9ALTE|nr:MerR family transcriptional regulator [Aestuariibacter halophilus]MCC2616026.1 MerR family transcriptional regulator [Aestuariibacter halophilus]